MNHEDVRRHIASFPSFQKITLQNLSPTMIRDWLLWMAEKGLSGHRINRVLQMMRVAVRDAVSREELSRDPFKGVGEAAEITKAKGILTPEEVNQLIKAPINDLRYRLSLLLGVLCGMRLGEVRGLKWEDIDGSLIHIRHNWIDGEGIKAPKCKGGSVRQNIRTVPLPRPVLVILDALKEKAINPIPEAFVFEGNDCPLSKGFFRHGFEVELGIIDIPGEWPRWKKDKTPDGYVNEQRKRNLTFHSLRHTFITLGRLAGITDLEIQTLAGHKSGAMMEHYTHAGQVLDFTSAREKLEKAVGEKGA